jgi:hypothetical protein
MKCVSRANVAWAISYVLWIGMLTYFLHTARPRLIESFGTATAQQDWDAFVQEARKQAAGEGPVARRVPRSAEPPALVLMRDYYATCLVATLLFGSLLFGVLMMLVRGVFTKSAAHHVPPVE